MTRWVVPDWTPITRSGGHQLHAETQPVSKLNMPKAVPRRSGGAASATRLVSRPWVEPPKHDTDPRPDDIPRESGDQVGQEQKEGANCHKGQAVHPIRQYADGIGGDGIG